MEMNIDGRFLKDQESLVIFVESGTMLSSGERRHNGYSVIRGSEGQSYGSPHQHALQPSLQPAPAPPRPRTPQYAQNQEEEITLLRQAVTDMSRRMQASASTSNASASYYSTHDAVHAATGNGIIDSSQQATAAATWGGSFSCLELWRTVATTLWTWRHSVFTMVALCALTHAAHTVAMQPHKGSDALTSTNSGVWGLFIACYFVGLIGIGTYATVRYIAVRHARLCMEQNARAFVSALCTTVSARVKKAQLGVEREAAAAVGSVSRLLVLAESLLLTSYLCSSSDDARAAGVMEGLSLAMTEHLLDPDEADFFSHNDLNIIPVPAIVYAWVRAGVQNMAAAGLLGASTEPSAGLLALLTNVEQAATALQMSAAWTIPVEVRIPFVALSLGAAVGAVHACAALLASSWAAHGLHTAASLDPVCVYVGAGAWVYAVSLGVEAADPMSLATVLGRHKSVPEYLMNTRNEFEAVSSCIARTTGKHALGRRINVTHFGQELRTVGPSPPQARAQAQAQAQAAYRHDIEDNAMV